jgi:hypothetical protein
MGYLYFSAELGHDPIIQFGVKVENKEENSAKRSNSLFAPNASSRKIIFF